MSSTATDGKQFSNISATTLAFRLNGGKYAIAASATFGGGNLQLQTLALDGTTWINVGSAISAAGLTTFDLPPGQFRIAVTTATAVYAAITRIPV
jgi:hypothetical protein